MKMNPKTVRFILELIIAVASAASGVLIKHYDDKDQD